MLDIHGTAIHVILQCHDSGSVTKNSLELSSSFLTHLYGLGTVAPTTCFNLEVERPDMNPITSTHQGCSVLAAWPDMVGIPDLV